jgi:Gpi18-like mannosyltransferase
MRLATKKGLNEAMSLGSKTVWFSYLIHILIVGAGMLLADYLPKHDPAGFINPFLSLESPITEKLIKWDAHWYTYVAETGYTTQTIVFFPVIIALIRLVAATGVDYAWAGLIVCNLFVFLSFNRFYALFRLDYSEEQTRNALLAYAVMPTSFFMNSVYTEPIFLTLAAQCIYLARKHQWWSSGLFAALATLTRNIGIALFFIMLYEGLRIHSNGGRARLPMLAVFFAPLALVGFICFNYWLTGDAVAFVHSQQLWGRQFSLPWISIWLNFFAIYYAEPFVEPGVVLDSILVILTLIALFLLATKRYQIPTSYLIIGWLWFLIPLVSSSPLYPLYSMARFVLIVFPLYLFLAQLPKLYFRCYLLFSTVLMVVCTALFINWYWLG